MKAFPRKLDGRTISDAPGEIRAFSVVRDEARRLPASLERHFAMGVDRWFFVDDRSEDGTRELLLADPRVHVFASPGRYADSRCGHDWLETLLDAYGGESWNLVLDGDEWLWLPYEIRLPEAIRVLERNGATALAAVLVDLYGRGPLADGHFVAGRSALETAPFFDRPSAVGAPLERRGEAFNGGVRRRLFGLDCCVGKVPLFRGGTGFRASPGMHVATGARFGPHRAALLHFKLADDFPRRVAVEARRGEHWENGYEYRRYYRAVTASPGLSAFDPRTSVRWSDEAGRATGLLRWPGTDRVTVLLPVKNAMPFLTEALASLAAQTWKDFEVLAWDNGSTDGSLEELRRWIPERLPGRIVADRPLPLAECLAAMVESAETALCARFDADDVCFPERLAVQVEALATRPEIVALGSQFVAIDRNGRKLRHQYPLPTAVEDVAHALLSDNAVAHSSVMFRREAVLAVGNYRPAPAGATFHFEDYDLWLRIAARFGLANLPVPLLRYRVHENSVMGKAARAGLVRKETARVFAAAAGDLCGIEGPEAERFFLGLHPDPVAVARRVAKHLDTVRTSRDRGRWRSPSFLRSMAKLVPFRKVGSKLGFVFRHRWSVFTWTIRTRVLSWVSS